MDIKSTKLTNTIPKNVATNSDRKNIRNKIVFYIFHTVLLVMILLSIAIICYHNAKHRLRIKSILTANNIKIENNEFLKVCIKNFMWSYFDDK